MRRPVPQYSDYYQCSSSSSDNNNNNSIAEERSLVAGIIDKGRRVPPPLLKKIKTGMGFYKKERRHDGCLADAISRFLENPSVRTFFVFSDSISHFPFFILFFCFLLLMSTFLMRRDEPDNKNQKVNSSFLLFFVFLLVG